MEAGVACCPRVSASRPQPWAGLCRPVGPVGPSPSIQPGLSVEATTASVVSGRITATPRGRLPSPPGLAHRRLANAHRRLAEARRPLAPPPPLRPDPSRQLGRELHPGGEGEEVGGQGPGDSEKRSASSSASAAASRKASSRRRASSSGGMRASLLPAQHLLHSVEALPLRMEIHLLLELRQNLIDRARLRHPRLLSLAIPPDRGTPGHDRRKARHRRNPGPGPVPQDLIPLRSSRSRSGQRDFCRDILPFHREERLIRDSRVYLRRWEPVRRDRAWQNRGIPRRCRTAHKARSRHQGVISRHTISRSRRRRAV